MYCQFATSYASLLLDNTALKAHMYRMHLTETDVCECGQAVEDPYHFLLERVCYHQLHKNLVDTVQQACLEDNNGHTPQLSVALLLSPGTSDCVSKTGRLGILLALFNFIQQSGRRL